MQTLFGAESSFITINAFWVGIWMDTYVNVLFMLSLSKHMGYGWIPALILAIMDAFV